MMNCTKICRFSLLHLRFKNTAHVFSLAGTDRAECDKKNKRLRGTKGSSEGLSLFLLTCKYFRPVFVGLWQQCGFCVVYVSSERAEKQDGLL